MAIIEKKTSKLRYLFKGYAIIVKTSLQLKSHLQTKIVVMFWNITYMNKAYLVTVERDRYLIRQNNTIYKFSMKLYFFILLKTISLSKVSYLIK